MLVIVSVTVMLMVVVVVVVIEITPRSDAELIIVSSHTTKVYPVSPAIE